MNKVTKLIFDEGIERGGQRKVVFLVRKLGKDMEQKEIAELLEENEEQIGRIIFLIKNNPNADDEKICEMLQTVYAGNED